MEMRAFRIRYRKVSVCLFPKFFRDVFERANILFYLSQEHGRTNIQFSFAKLRREYSVRERTVYA